MRILAIETSCDETGVSIVEASGALASASFRVLGDALLSQAAAHAEFGGVYPNLAKREHAKHLAPLLAQTLREAGMYVEPGHPLPEPLRQELEELLAREPALFEKLVPLLETIEKPNVDAIAVTVGPGLEPALWVGINFAKALARVWEKPLIPVNHMEGHLIASFLDERNRMRPSAFPALALLISGAHTELVLMRDFGNYDIVGETRDDAVGEAFDKVARMLGLPYPGGPEIARLAREARAENLSAIEPLPRPMLRADNFDFSFAGLKTAVLYRLKNSSEVSNTLKKQIARAFEDAAVEVLVEKTRSAIREFGVRSVAVGGGVSANEEVRDALARVGREEGAEVFVPKRALTTDNAVMIAAAAYVRVIVAPTPVEPADIRANGTMRL